MKRFFLFLTLVGASAGAFAGTPAAPADLPPGEVVVRMLASHPAVQAAEAQARVAEAERRRLEAGEHEFNLNLTGQRRRESAGPEYLEWQAGLSRGLRLPGKAGLDVRIGEMGVHHAEERIGDARHETGRQLLAAWYGFLQAKMGARLWQEQTELLREQVRVVDLRIKRGDAAQIERMLAEAVLSQAISQAGQAEAVASIARAEFLAQFPDVPPPVASTAEPVLPEGGEADWVARVLEHNHELQAAQLAFEQAGLQRRRAESERLPDPTVGMFYGHEADGRERVLGLSVNLALPGEARRAASEASAARAEVAAAEFVAVRRRLAGEAVAAWQRAVAGVESHQRLKVAAEAVTRHAALAQRAYELGELGLSETLLARRSALEAQLALVQARLAGNEAVARLLIDAHALWPMPEAPDELAGAIRSP